MDLVIKIVISVDNNEFSIELAFNILQRKVFADRLLDIYILTSDVDEVKAMAVYIEKSCFSNLNEFVVTQDYREAFQNADYLLLMSNLSVQEIKTPENFQNLTHVIEKAKIYDRLASPNARVLIMGSQTNLWLQLFAEATSNLSKHNFTGLSRHYMNIALICIARKLACDAQQLSDLFIWGDNYLDISNGKNTEFDLRKYSLPYKSNRQNVTELLSSNWIDNLFTLLSQIARTTPNRYCIISAVCHHLIDWSQGTCGKIVSMTTIVQQPGKINDGIYSSYPVTVDKNRNISIVHDIEVESSIFVKLYRFYENQQKQKFRIRKFLNNMNKTTNYFD